MAEITICSDFGAKKKIKSVTISTVSPSISYEVMGPDAMIIVFWMFEFQSPYGALSVNLGFPGGALDSKH